MVPIGRVKGWEAEYMKQSMMDDAACASSAATAWDASCEAYGQVSRLRAEAPRKQAKLPCNK